MRIEERLRRLEAEIAALTPHPRPIIMVEQRGWDPDLFEYQGQLLTWEEVVEAAPPNALIVFVRLCPKRPGGASGVITYDDDENDDDDD
jgi:hypothetical protein